MEHFYEESDALNHPVECFWFDTRRERFPIPSHWHYFMELIYVREGRVMARVEDEIYSLAPGDVLLIQPKQSHSFYFSSDKGAYARYQVIKLDINRMKTSVSYAPKFRNIFLSAREQGMPNYFKATMFAPGFVENVFDVSIREMQNHCYGYDILIYSKLYELLIRMIRYWQCNHNFAIQREVFTADTEYDIYSITDYIGENLQGKILVSNIAQLCGMSYSYFAKEFLRVYGRTCKEYIEELRIHQVEELLLFTDFDLNYIAQECGFSDCSHMIKSFRRYKETTPKQFRKYNRT